MMKGIQVERPVDWVVICRANHFARERTPHGD